MLKPFTLFLVTNLKVKQSQISPKLKPEPKTLDKNTKTIINTKIMNLTKQHKGHLYLMPPLSLNSSDYCTLALHSSRPHI